MQKCGLRSAYQPFYHHKWWSAVQNSLECNSHASFQESFKVNKCMSVPIEKFDFLSKLLTNSGVQCRIPSPHHSNILSSLHEQELLMHSYDCFIFVLPFFTLATVATTNHYSKQAPLMKLLIFLTSWTLKRLILQYYTVCRV